MGRKRLTQAVLAGMPDKSPVEAAAGVSEGAPERVSGRLLPGDDGYLDGLYPKQRDGWITAAEFNQAALAHAFVRGRRAGVDVPEVRAGAAAPGAQGRVGLLRLRRP
jgi:hypothetical protein